MFVFLFPLPLCCCTNCRDGGLGRGEALCRGDVGYFWGRRVGDARGDVGCVLFVDMTRSSWDWGFVVCVGGFRSLLIALEFSVQRPCSASHLLFNS